MKTPEENTELDYQICERLEITMDELDTIPLSVVNAMRTREQRRKTMRRIYAVPEYVLSKHIPENIAKHCQTIGHEIAYKYDNNASVSELAKSQGLVNFDTALPIDWVRQFQDQTGFSPVGHLVMDYTNNSLGVPKPITIEGQVAYKIFLHINGIDLG